MAIQRGDELSLYGKDGQVYKGRGNTTTVFAPGERVHAIHVIHSFVLLNVHHSLTGDPAKSSTFNVIYSDKNPGNRPAHGPPYATPYTVPRPFSAGPSRSNGLGGTYTQSLSSSSSGGGGGGTGGASSNSNGNTTGRSSRVQSFGSSVRPRTAHSGSHSPNRSSPVVHHSHPLNGPASSTTAPYYSPSPPPQSIASYATEFKESKDAPSFGGGGTMGDRSTTTTMSKSDMSQQSSVATTPSTPFVTTSGSSSNQSSNIGGPTPTQRTSTPSTASSTMIPTAWDTTGNSSSNGLASGVSSMPTTPGTTDTTSSSIAASGRKGSGKRSNSRSGHRENVAFR
jgi:hypothetical protein